MDEKKTEVITYRTTPEIKQYLETEAKKTKRNASWLSNEIITEYVKSKKEGKQVQININYNENINL